MYRIVFLISKKRASCFSDGAESFRSGRRGAGVPVAQVILRIARR